MKLPLIALATLAALATGAHAQVLNIDATQYGFAFPTDPAPVVGQVITPITNPGGGPHSMSGPIYVNGAEPGDVLDLGSEALI